MNLIYSLLKYFIFVVSINALEVYGQTIIVDFPNGPCKSGYEGMKRDLYATDCDWLTIDYKAINKTAAEIDFFENKLVIKDHCNFCEVTAFREGKEIDRATYRGRENVEISFKFDDNTVVEMLGQNHGIMQAFAIYNPDVNPITFKYEKYISQTDYNAVKFSMDYIAKTDTSMMIKSSRKGRAIRIINPFDPYKISYYDENGKAFQLPFTPTEDILFDLKISPDTKLIFSPVYFYASPPDKTQIESKKINGKPKFTENPAKSNRFMYIIIFGAVTGILVIIFLGTMFF